MGYTTSKGVGRDKIITSTVDFRSFIDEDASHSLFATSDPKYNIVHRLPVALVIAIKDVVKGLPLAESVLAVGTLVG